MKRADKKIEEMTEKEKKAGERIVTLEGEITKAIADVWREKARGNDLYEENKKEKQKVKQIT